MYFTPEVEYEVVGDAVSKKLCIPLVNSSNAHGREPCTYSMAFPTSVGSRNFPIKGCPGRAGESDGDAG